MKIENVKINGIKNPVGYAMETPVVSWCVTECLGGYQTSVRIDVSPDEDFSEIIFTIWFIHYTSCKLGHNSRPLSIRGTLRYASL